MARVAALASLSWLWVVGAAGCGGDDGAPGAVDVPAEVDAGTPPETSGPEPDAGGTPDAGGPEVDLTAAVFDPDHVLMIDIQLSGAHWDALKHQTRSIVDLLGPGCFTAPPEDVFTWFTATVTVDGERLEQVAVRKKGLLGSLDKTKPSLKLKFNEYVAGQRYSGMRRLTLNNAKSDPSYLNQCLAYHLFAGAGVPAPRCNFAVVTVNSDPPRLYVNVESLKKPLIARHFADDGGNLYEGTLSDFRPGWIETFELKTNKTTPDLSGLDAAVAALEVDDDALLEALAARFDVDAFVSFWAVEVLVAHLDGYAGNANNYYLYDDPTSGLYHFLPWGTDAVFRPREEVFGEGSGAPTTVLAQAALARRLYLHPDGQAQYLDRLQELLDTVWDEAALLAEVARMETLVRPYLNPWEVGAFDEGVARVTGYVEGKRAEVLAELATGPVPWPHPLRDKPCFEAIGHLDATLDTTWGSLGAANPFEVASGTADVVIDGGPVEITGVGGGVGMLPDEPGRALVQLLLALPDGKIAIVYVATPLEVIAAGASIPIDWELTEAYLLLYDPQTEQDPALVGLLADGTLDLGAAEQTHGAPVTISMALAVLAP